MAARAKSECDHCGGYDDHPKVHIGSVTKHHDCLSVAEKAQVTEQAPAAAEIIQACEDGKRGADLLDFIKTLHSEEEVK